MEDPSSLRLLPPFFHPPSASSHFFLLHSRQTSLEEKKINEPLRDGESESNWTNRPGLLPKKCPLSSLLPPCPSYCHRRYRPKTSAIGSIFQPEGHSSKLAHLSIVDESSHEIICLLPCVSISFQLKATIYLHSYCRWWWWWCACASGCKVWVLFPFAWSERMGTMQLIILGLSYRTPT